MFYQVKSGHNSNSLNSVIFKTHFLINQFLLVPSGTIKRLYKDEQKLCCCSMLPWMKITVQIWPKIVNQVMPVAARKLFSTNFCLFFSQYRTKMFTLNKRIVEVF